MSSSGENRGKPDFFSVLLYVIVSVCAAFVFFAPRLLQGFVLAPEDGYVQNFPGFASATKTGLLWTDLILTGYPVAADPQLALFYPLRALAGLFPPFLGWNLYVVSAFALAAFFMALFCRRLTGSTLAGLVGGILYGFGGYQISELRHVQVLHVAAWLPLALLLVDNLGENRNRTVISMCALAVVFAMAILAGHPQTAVYVIGCVLAYSLFGPAPKPAAAQEQSRPRFNLRCIAAIAAVILASMISAVQILPTLELVNLTGRPAFTSHEFLSGQVEPFQLLGFLIPYVMGPRYGSLDGMPFSEQGPPPGLLFYGLGAVFLALLAWPVRKTQPVYFFSGLIIVSLAYALGERGIAPALACLPPFKYFRELYRVLLLAGFSISALASIGTAVLEKSVYHGGSWISGIRSWPIKYHFCLALYVFLALLIPPLLPGTLPLFLYYRSKNKLTEVLLVVSLYAVSLNYAWLSQYYKNCPAQAEFTAPISTPALIKDLGSRQRIFTLKGLEASHQAFPPNLSRLWQVPSAGGYEPLMPVRYASLLGIAEGGFLNPPWRISAANRAFDICSVRYFLAPQYEFGPAAFHDGAERFWPLLKEEGGVLIYENARCLPRFRLVHEVRKLSAAEILRTIRQGIDGSKFEPADTALVEEGVNSQWPSSKGEIEEKLVGDEEILLRIKTDGPAYLIVADQYYPGWLAEVDGRATPLICTNYVQRGLFIDAGDHEVRLHYEPQSFKNGLILSCFSLVFVLFLCWLAKPTARSLEKKRMSE